MASNERAAIPRLSVEAKFIRDGAITIAGVDEVGRGSWAGPLFASAVMLDISVLRNRRRLREVTDSKRLTPRTRERLFDDIYAEALSVAVASASVAEIDAMGIVQATMCAMRRAVGGLNQVSDVLLVDYLSLEPVSSGQRVFSLSKADSRCLSVASASICAKVIRDRYMTTLSSKYPEYGFDKNAGYGTAQHKKAILRHGPCSAHRISFKPINSAKRA
tara:strand:- start:12003 stop:12656 length:654 start_codon:yes stop_codon:yes gene_type:complete